MPLAGAPLAAAVARAGFGLVAAPASARYRLQANLTRRPIARAQAPRVPAGQVAQLRPSCALAKATGASFLRVVPLLALSAGARAEVQIFAVRLAVVPRASPLAALR